MEKLLYITDQEEYSERGTIGPLFNDYLKKYLEINMVYVTKYKHSFQKKGDDYIIPIAYKKDIMGYLDSKGIELASYSFVFVRNRHDILKSVLKYKSKLKCQYKIGYRVSYPKTIHIFEAIEARQEGHFLKAMFYKFENFLKRGLANKCDLFMPSSLELQNEFYPNISIRSLPIYSGLDPKKLKVTDIIDSSAKRFVYVGTVDELRKFDTILNSFDQLRDEDWSLTICTTYRDYITKLLTFYPKISEKIEVVRAGNLEELSEIVDSCDISLALLPNIPIYNTTIPAKVLDGYSSAIPALITNNSKNRDVFTEEDVFFSNFDTKSIVESLRKILNTSKEDMKTMGKHGQDRLLKLNRNYEVMAKNLYRELKEL